ncbi:MAG: polysaccharide deacetylase family protein, partial [bacterium]
GVSVQSHGASHTAFSQLDVSAHEEEACRSKAVLQAGLGTRVELFSYPYGDPGKDPHWGAKILQRAGYQGACLYGGSVHILPVTDFYRLERIAMGPDTDLACELSVS